HPFGAVARAEGHWEFSSPASWAPWSEGGSGGSSGQGPCSRSRSSWRSRLMCPPPVGGRYTPLIRGDSNRAHPFETGALLVCMRRTNPQFTELHGDAEEIGEVPLLGRGHAGAGGEDVLGDLARRLLVAQPPGHGGPQLGESGGGGVGVVEQHLGLGHVDAVAVDSERVGQPHVSRQLFGELEGPVRSPRDQSVLD